MMNLTRIQAFLEGMEQFGKIIDIFPNTSPVVAFVWGPVKFQLQVASTWAESFDILLDAYEQIGENIPQFEEYKSLFDRSPYMQRALEWVYSDILEFHRRALKFFQRRTWRQLFLSTWKDFKTRFQWILDSLQRHKSLIETQASLLEFHQSQMSRASMENNFSRIQEDERKRRHVAVTAWLSPANSRLDQNNAASERKEYPETGRWLLDYHKVKSWLDQNSYSIPLLWISGIPGAGMTVLWT